MTPPTHLGTQWVAPVMPNRKSPELLIVMRWSDGVVTLFCTCNRHQRPTCEAQRWVLDRYDDLDDVGRTIVSHSA